MEKVNEVMDEHDRVLVGSVVPGDELLDVDGVTIAHHTFEQVRNDFR